MALLSKAAVAGPAEFATVVQQVMEGRIVNDSWDLTDMADCRCGFENACDE